MKIAFLNIYQGLVDRGAETFVYELGKRLPKKYKVDILGGVSLPPARWKFLWRTFLDPQGLSVAWFTLRLLPKIWREKYDIIIPLNGGWQPAFVRLLTWLYGGRIVISGQSGKGWDDRNNLWCFPDAFVALSSHAKNWAKRANPFVKVENIPNGADTRKFTPQGEALRIRLTRPILICVGALTSTKRIDLAIKAVSRLKDISLLVVGDGDLRDEINTLGKKLLKDKFQLIKVPFEEMPKVYRVADVFTIPSESYYSFEIVLAEAMATNIPVVANDDPIRREIVGDAGLFVDPTDTNGYAKKLQEALLIDWGNKPRKQAKKFSWDRIAGDYERLFRELTLSH